MVLDVSAAFPALRHFWKKQLLLLLYLVGVSCFTYSIHQ